MDPWSVAAVVGLVYAGSQLNRDDDEPMLLTDKETSCPPTRNPRDHDLDYMQSYNMTPDVGRRIGNVVLPPKCGIPSLQDRKPQQPYGQPVYNLYDRVTNVTNKMNNLQPVERRNVGPGLGVDSSVPATGGFQQFFRVLPNNPNDERLVQLPGTNGGPMDAVVKQGSAQIGTLTQFPEKLYTYEPAQNSGQGQGGVLRGQESRPDHTKTVRSTNRQQTGFRGEEDDVGYGAAQYNVFQLYDDKGRLARHTDNRSKPDREGNGQRMNVRADPLDAGGLVTNLRRQYATNEPGPVDGARFQQYVDSQYYKLNEFKSTPNPLTDTGSLSLAKDVLKNNPLAIPPLSG